MKKKSFLGDNPILVNMSYLIPDIKYILGYDVAL